MSKERELLARAASALHDVFDGTTNDGLALAEEIDKLLAEPEAEPVAWTSMEQLVVGEFLSTAKSMWLAPGLSPYANVPLYTHPPRQPVQLSDMQKRDIIRNAGVSWMAVVEATERAVIAAYEEKQK